MKLTPNDIEEFYAEHLSFDTATRVTQPDGTEELTTICPFHDDTKPSLSVNLSKGIFKCHTESCPQSQGGNIYTFYSVVKEVDDDTARKMLHERFKKEVKPLPKFPITEEIVEQWHKTLVNNEKLVGALAKKCQWTLETIREFELGWNGTRITIPIRVDSQLINVRQYALHPSDGNKVIGIRGFNTAALWPVENTDNAEIYIFEGEKDCMLACQLGLPAVTVTGGSGTFKLEWRSMFSNKRVNICYDIDEAGKEGATKVAQLLAGIAKEVKIISLPITEPSNGDFTDYILQDNTVQDFHELVDKASSVQQKDDTYVVIDDEVLDSNLEDASYAGLFFKRLRIKIRILGKDLAPFIIPREIVATCGRGMDKKCLTCGLTRHTNNSTSLILDETRPELLAFFNCTTSQQKQILKQTFKIPEKCNSYGIVQKDHQFVEEINVIPFIDEQSFEENYMKRTMYVINRKLEANRDYEVEALTVPDPRTQYLVHIVYKARPCETSIDEFKMDANLFEELRVFQCPQTISVSNLNTSTTTSQQT